MLQRAPNYFDDLLLRLNGSGVPLPVAVERVATAYLDGKPLRVGKKKLTKRERDSLFWSSDVVKGCPPDAWNGEAMVLALARYLGQEIVAAEGLVTRVAREAPDALIRAVRYSGLVLKPHSLRRVELEQAAAEGEAVAEPCRVLDLFALAHRERVAAVEVQKARLVGLQNNSAAAINNLRRLGARRGQARDEARRIEAGLARLLETRGFKTLLNWNPPRDVDDPGEVDLIAILGQHSFVIEVKSTFLRRSQRDAWLHATGTLRKAGHQVRRKVEAVVLAISSNPELRALLDLTEDRVPTHHHGWIADTSVECDHQRFAGFLKVSVEELLIALRDDRHLLNESEDLLAGNYREDQSHEADTSRSAWTLYPDGFSAERFIDVIETGAVWDLRD